MAIFGTTISPYLFFWQSAQEVEEVDQRPDRHRACWMRPGEAPAADYRVSKWTRSAACFASNVIALAIMIVDRRHA